MGVYISIKWVLIIIGGSVLIAGGLVGILLIVTSKHNKDEYLSDSFEKSKEDNHYHDKDRD